MKSLASLLAVLSAIAVGFGARPAAAATSPGLPCSDLAQLTFEGNTTITAATTVSGGRLKSFDFDKDMAAADAKVGAMADGTSTDFSAAKSRGVKAIMYHGWNDAVLQPEYTPQYYEKVAATNGGIDKTKDFMRLFMVPGMQHCSGGPGANSFGGVGQQIPPARDPAHDVQTALEAWVEQGVAPNHVVATRYADDAAATRTITSTRLLCPYPQVPKYKGSGDRADAASFQCVAP